MPVEVTRLAKAYEPAWRAYVAAHPQGTFFHTLVWRDSVADAFGHQDCSWVAWRNGQVVGVLPMMRVHSRLAGTLLVSMPYAVYGGALTDDAQVADALLDHLRRVGDHMKVQWIDIRSAQPQWPELPVLSRYVTFRKELPDDPGRVLEDMPRKARAAARQARERYELRAVFEDDELDTIWSLYSQSMRRLASPNYPTGFFEALVDRTRPLADHPDEPRHVLQVVLHRDRPVAGLLSFVFKGTMLPYFAGCDERFEKYHPNNFLYLTAMEKAVELGCRQFDFGRSRVDNAGSYNFKRFQGFEPTPLNYQFYVPRGGRHPDLHPGNPKLALARRVWPKLPLAVTRPLGAWLAKSIPG